MPRFHSYVICTSPRSGSTLLCKLLQGAGHAGVPNSHFHAPSLEKWLGYHGLRGEDFGTRQDALRAVFAAAIARGKGTSDIFGVRLQRHSFDYFMEQLRGLYPSCADEKSRIIAAFGPTLFIHLTREDKLEQAISYVRAQQSGLWHVAPDGTELERVGAPRTPVYDAPAIAAQLAASEQMDAQWLRWFEAERIRPLPVRYEDLSAAPYATLGRVLEALGLPSEPREEGTPPVAKMADAINRDWAERFRLEQGF